MKSHVNSILRTLDGMKNVELPRGFERNLDTQLTHEMNEDKVFLKSIELQTVCPSRRAVTCFVDVRKDILDALSKFLTQRFKIDEPLLEKITPFISFSQDSDIKEIHSLLAPDISLPDLYAVQ